MPITIGVTIMQSKTTGRFEIFSDDGVNIGSSYATLEEADTAARAWAYELSRSRKPERSRVPQATIDKLLLSDVPLDKPYARLLASETWPAFEAWLDSEPTDTREQVTALLNALTRFSAVIIGGFAREYWGYDPSAQSVIRKLAATHLKQMMAEPR